MKLLVSKILMKIIPWRIWSWSATTRLMRWNYLLNREEFDRLANDKLGGGQIK